MIELGSDLIVSPLAAASTTEIGLGCLLVLIFVDTVPLNDNGLLELSDLPIVHNIVFTVL